MGGELRGSGAPMPRIEQYSSVNTQCFVIKYYNFEGGFSKFLHELDDGSSEKFLVRGPLGPGLKLKHDSKGQHIALTAGTGCLVFLDLVAYLYRKITKQYTPEYSIFEDDKVEELSQDFKFKLYISFPTRSECLGRDLCLATKTKSEYYETGMFDYYERISDEGHARWGLAFVKEELQKYPNFEKIWICGPPAFNDLMEDILLNTLKVDPMKVELA